MGDKPRLTEAELSRKLVGARKIMSKVDTGDYETGFTNTDVLFSDPENLMNEGVAPVSSPATRPVGGGKVDIDRVNQTRLPDAIKKAMIENPIESIALNDTLDMDFVNKTRRLMEQEGVPAKKGVQPFSQGKGTTPKQVTSEGSIPSSSELERRLTPIIENTIRKVMEEIFDRKLTQLLTAEHTTSINENVAIKVGDTIFTGKITKSKSIK